MNRLVLACLVWFTYASIPSLADESVLTGHSTVHILFMTPYSQPMLADGGMGGTGGSQCPLVRVGASMVPAGDVQPIRISIGNKLQAIPNC